MVVSACSLLGWLQILGEGFPELSWTLHKQHSSAPGEALQLYVLPRTWEKPLLGQLNLFSPAVAAHLEGLSCALVSPEPPPKSCDLESSKHTPALSSGHPAHLPDTLPDTGTVAKACRRKTFHRDLVEPDFRGGELQACTSWALGLSPMPCLLSGLLRGAF